MSKESLRRLFAQPRAMDRVAPFWFLNHRLEQDETRWQVREMHRQGVGGFVLHARHGLLTPYMGEEWMDNLAAAIEEGKRLGMKAYLYDENNWPSGPADGMTFEGHPEYRMSGLYLHSRRRVTGGRRVRVRLALGREDEVVAAVAVPADGAGPVGFPETARLLNDCLDGDEVRVGLPEGRWLLYVFVRRFLVGRTFFGTYLDTLNPAAVRRFIELTHEPYAKRFGEEFGATVVGMFTDEPTMNFNPPDAAPWTEELPAEFEWRKGYDLLPVLPALFEDVGPATAKVRCDFYDVVSELYAESFFGQIYRWCDERRIKLMGHPHFEGELVEHARQQGHWFRVMRYMHWGGVDQLCELTWPEGRGLNNLAGPKLASSASHLLGKDRTDCECFGLASQWGIDLRNLKWIGDWLACMGVNVFIPHAFYYSIQGFRKWECPPGEFYQSPFWPYYRVFADHMARLAALLCDGEHVADVAVLYPVRSVWAELAPHGTETAWYLQDHFNMLGEALLRINRDFDFVSEEMLWEAEVHDGEIVVKVDGVQRERYKVLVLPALTTLSERTVEALERMLREGAKMLGTGSPPVRTCEKVEEGEDVQARLRALVGDEYALSPAPEDADRVRMSADVSSGWDGAMWIWLPPRPDKEVFEALGECLDAGVEPDVRIISAEDGTRAWDVVHYHWRREGLEFYVVHNTSRERPWDVWVEIAAKGEVTLWDPDTGSVEPAPVVQPGEKTRVRLWLEPVDTKVVCCDPAAEPAAVGVTDVSLPAERLEGDALVCLAPSAGTYWASVARRGAEERVSVNVADVPAAVELEDRWEFETMKPNALPLTNWTMEMRSQVLGRDHAGARLEFVAQVQCEVVPEEARLLLDGLAAERVWHGTAGVPFEVQVNGEKLTDWRPGEYLDHYIYEAAVGGLLRTGANEIRVVTASALHEMAALRYPPILIGRFAVRGRQRPRLVPEPEVIDGRGWEKQGYPYYSGIGVYRQSVRLSRTLVGHRLFLEFDKPGDLVEVLVNGQSCGVRAWEPWRVEISPAVRAGANVVELRVANALQNLLVQEPKPSGVLGRVRIVPCAEVRFPLS